MHGAASEHGDDAYTDHFFFHRDDHGQRIAVEVAAAEHLSGVSIGLVVSGGSAEEGGVDVPRVDAPIRHGLQLDVRRQSDPALHNTTFHEDE